MPRKQIQEGIRSTDSLSGTASEIDNSEIEKVQQYTLRHSRHTFYVVNARVHFGLPGVASRVSLMILRGMRVAVVLVDRIELYGGSHFHASIAACVYRAGAGSGTGAFAYMGDRVIPVVHTRLVLFWTGEEIQYPRFPYGRSVPG